MKMMISRDRLREKIRADADHDFEAGYPTHALSAIYETPPAHLENEAFRLKAAFGVFVRQIRRAHNYSVQQLSEKARIAEEEVRSIEHDPHHKPRPRTVHQLAAIFNLPERALLKLSGSTVTKDPSFAEEAYRFAAKSDDMSQLSREEQKALKEYIRFLSAHDGR